MGNDPLQRLHFSHRAAHGGAVFCRDLVGRGCGVSDADKHLAQEIVNSCAYNVSGEDGTRFKESLLVPLIATALAQQRAPLESRVKELEQALTDVKKYCDFYYNARNARISARGPRGGSTDFELEAINDVYDVCHQALGKKGESK